MPSDKVYALSEERGGLYQDVHIREFSEISQVKLVLAGWEVSKDSVENTFLLCW